MYYIVKETNYIKDMVIKIFLKNTTVIYTIQASLLTLKEQDQVVGLRRTIISK